MKGRDSFISPIYDFQTFQERFTMDDERTENNLRLEFRANQWESTLAMKFLALLVGIPLLTGWGTCTFVADPILKNLQEKNPGVREENYPLRLPTNPFELPEVQLLKENLLQLEKISFFKFYKMICFVPRPQAFTLTRKQKVRAAQLVHREEERVRFQAGIGQAPPLTEDSLVREGGLNRSPVCIYASSLAHI